MEKKKILIVCTGNTCRSPMAEAVLSQLLGEKGLLGQYDIHSAGIAAYDGENASPNAVIAARELGLDLSGHCSKRISKADIDEADRIFVMSDEHKRILASAVPGTADKTVVMHVADPYGGDVEEYRATLKQMKDFFTGYLQENPF